MSAALAFCAAGYGSLVVAFLAYCVACVRKLNREDRRL
jgi:hypothetical protein